MSADGQGSAPPDDAPDDGSIRRLDDAAMLAVGMWRMAQSAARTEARLDQLDASLTDLRARIEIMAARQDERHGTMAGQLADVRHEVQGVRSGLHAPGSVERLVASLPGPVRGLLLVLIAAGILGGDDLIRAALTALTSAGTGTMASVEAGDADHGP